LRSGDDPEGFFAPVSAGGGSGTSGGTVMAPSNAEERPMFSPGGAKGGSGIGTLALSADLLSPPNVSGGFAVADPFPLPIGI